MIMFSFCVSAEEKWCGSVPMSTCATDYNAHINCLNEYYSGNADSDSLFECTESYNSVEWCGSVPMSSCSIDPNAHINCLNEYHSGNANLSTAIRCAAAYFSVERCGSVRMTDCSSNSIASRTCIEEWKNEANVSIDKLVDCIKLDYFARYGDNPIIYPEEKCGSVPMSNCVDNPDAHIICLNEWKSGINNISLEDIWKCIGLNYYSNKMCGSVPMSTCAIDSNSHITCLNEWQIGINNVQEEDAIRCASIYYSIERCGSVETSDCMCNQTKRDTCIYEWQSGAVPIQKAIYCAFIYQTTLDSNQCINNCGDRNCSIEEGEDCTSCPQDCGCSIDEQQCCYGVCKSLGETCDTPPEDDDDDDDGTGPGTGPGVGFMKTSCLDLSKSECEESLNWNDAVISTIEDHNSMFKEYDFCDNPEITMNGLDGCEGYFKCGCKWDGGSNKCIEYTELTPSNPLETGCNTESVLCYTDVNVSGDCLSEKEYTLEWTANWGIAGSNTKNETAGCTDGQKTLPCPNKEVMVPFFSLFNLIEICFAITVIYLIIIKQRKKV